MPEYQKIAVTMPPEVLARLEERAASLSGGNRSLRLAEDLRAFYDLTARARRQVLSLLTPEEVALCRATLSGTFLEPSIAPHLPAEIAEALAAEGREEPRLRAKLEGLGLMERYALMEALRDGGVAGGGD